LQAQHKSEQASDGKEKRYADQVQHGDSFVVAGEQPALQSVACVQVVCLAGSVGGTRGFLNFLHECRGHRDLTPVLRVEAGCARFSTRSSSSKTASTIKGGHFWDV